MLVLVACAGPGPGVDSAADKEFDSAATEDSCSGVEPTATEAPELLAVNSEVWVEQLDAYAVTYDPLGGVVMGPIEVGEAEGGPDGLQTIRVSDGTVLATRGTVDTTMPGAELSAYRGGIAVLGSMGTVAYGLLSKEEAAGYSGVAVLDAYTLDYLSTFEALSDEWLLRAHVGHGALIVGDFEASARRGALLVFQEPLQELLVQEDATAVHVGATEGDYLGMEVYTVGDVSGDGLEEWVFKADYFYLADGEDMLRDRGVEGSPVVDWYAAGPVHELGDVDGDGYGDFGVSRGSYPETAAFLAGSVTPSVYFYVPTAEGNDALELRRFTQEDGSGLVSLVVNRQSGNATAIRWWLAPLPTCGVIDVAVEGVRLHEQFGGDFVDVLSDGQVAWLETDTGFGEASVLLTW